MEEEFDAQKFFSKLLASGQFKVEKDGRILIQGVNIIAIPALTLAKLWKDTPPDVLYEAGKYQGRVAIELHTKYFGFTKKIAPKLLAGVMDKVLDFALSSYSAVSGFGQFCIEKYDKGKGELIVVNKTNPVARYYLKNFSKSDKPIDYFLVGLFEGALSEIGFKVRCVESKCIACGDDSCSFTITRVGDKNER